MIHCYVRSIVILPNSICFTWLCCFTSKKNTALENQENHSGDRDSLSDAVRYVGESFCFYALASARTDSLCLLRSQIYYCVLQNTFVQVLRESLTAQQYKPRALSVINRNLKLHYLSHYVSTYKTD